MERTTICEDAGAMTRVYSTTAESGCSERDETSTCVLNGGGGVTGNASASNCETSMWEEWTQATSTGVDEVSTSNFLPELTSSVTTSRLSFQHSDMLATWMSSFHPLAQASDLTGATSVVDSFMHEPSTVLALDPSELEVQAFPLGYEKAASHRRRALGPLSPSSPLAVQNGLLNPLGDPWDSSLQWSTVTTTGPGFNQTNDCKTTTTPLILDHLSTAVDHLKSSYGPRHTDIFIGPNGTFESATPGGWTPQLMYDTMSETTVGSSVTPMKLMASLREAAEASSSEVCEESKLQSDVGSVQPVISEPTCSSVTMSSILADCKSRAGAESTEGVWPGKHRLELVELVNGDEDLKNSSPRLLKKPKVSTPVEHAKALQWGEQTLKVAELRSYCPSSSSLSASQAMDIIAIGPALNTNGKPRARRGSATDPQSVYARHRREKINERLKNLQNLVPNGAKVDIVTMLDEAINYVKFLQNQLELLKSDDCWMYANPNNYNGMDLSEMCPELQSSAS